MDFRAVRTPRDHVSPNLTNWNISGGPKQYGVLVKDAVKAYGNRPPVLSKFNMRVEKGTIYGLLGSSGCGKTTILSCIVGLRELNSGEIVVCGEKPRPGPHIGYMPQELALYMNMTIKEIMQYYGRIYGMRQEDIMKRMKYLMSFLDLPDSARTISTLSGGQQRRTSLAVSLVHQPELLILDEPTVGVDPLVREKIWEHILNLVRRKKTTVIVTTHYIEEARSAHCVGLMRNGRLLCEKAPNALLEEYNAELLEDIVIKLCRDDEMTISPTPEVTEGNEVSEALQEISFYTGNKTLLNIPGGRGRVGHQLDFGDKSPVIPIKFKRRQTEHNLKETLKQRRQSVAEYVHEATEEFIYSRGDRIRALIIRNFFQVFRNWLFMIAILSLPSMQIIAINMVIGYEPKHLPFGMVNKETPEPVNGSFCPTTEGCFTGGAGCKFVSLLPEESFIMERLKSDEDAFAAVQRGSIWGYLSIPENYTNHLKYRAVMRNYVDNATIDGSTISIRMDMSQYLASALMIRQLTENYQKFLVNTANDCKQDAALAKLPIQYNKPIYGSLDTGYQEFIGPAALLVILYFAPLATGGIAYISDRKQGTLDRSMVAGVTNVDVIAAFMVTEGGQILFQVLMSFFIMTLVFGIEIKGSILLFLTMCVLTGLSGLSLGFLIAMLIDEEMEAVIVTLGLYTPMLLFSGIIWPLEGAADWVWYFSHSLPSTYPTEAIRSIISRGWGFTHSRVWPGFVVHILWTILCWILTAVAYRRRK